MLCSPIAALGSDQRTPATARHPSGTETAAPQDAANDDGAWSDIEEWLAELQQDPADVPTITVESFSQLSDVAQARHLQELVAVVHRCIAAHEIRTDQPLVVTDPRRTIEQFHRQKELPPTLPMPASYAALTVADGRLETTLSHDIPARARWNVRPADLRRALMSDDPSLRWFALGWLAERTDTAPARAVLGTLVREQDIPLRRLAISLLEQDRYLKAWNPTTPPHPRIIAGIRRMETTAPTEDDRLDAVFLRMWYGGGGETPSHETVFYLFERGLPVRWFKQLFRSAPPDMRRHFTVHVLRGLGRNVPLILEALEHVADDPVILETLSIVLVNRQARPIAPIRTQIVEVWERLTGIPFRGSDEPYREWYRRRIAR